MSLTSVSLSIVTTKDFDEASDPEFDKPILLAPSALATTTTCSTAATFKFCFGHIEFRKNLIQRNSGSL